MTYGRPKNRTGFFMRRLFTAFLSICFVVTLSVMAGAASSGTHKLVQLTTGKADTVNLGTAVADILVANPSIADVGTLRSNRVYIVGKAIGDTNVLAFDEEGNQLAEITVRVRADELSLQDSLKEFFPKEKIEVKTFKDEIVLRGRVSTPSVANQVRDLASRFVTAQGKSIVDIMSVAGEQQVMLKVRVLEAKRAVLREYGMNTEVDQAVGDSISLSSATIAGIGMTALSPFGGASMAMAQRGDFGPLSVAIEGLERDGLVNTLAEPNLTAISGETAGFLAGGEFPVPAGRDQDGNISLEFKQFGVSLNFTPTVLSEDQISLQLSTEVSTKSEEDGVTLQNIRVPGLAVRRAETTVQIGSGGTLMIAGLIKSDTLDSLNGLPGIKDVPIIGELFKSKSFSRNESEVIILVTPYLVKPYAAPEAVEVQPPAGPSFGAVDVNPGLGPDETSEKMGGLTPAPLPVSQPAFAPLSSPVFDGEKKASMRGAPDNPTLSKTFVQGMKSVYGARMPAQSVAAGYIVD